MSRCLILFCAAMIAAAPTYAAGADPQKAVQAMLDYCVAAIGGNTDPAALAMENHFPEFPPEEAQKFSPEGARVFGIVALKGQAVLMVPKTGGACSVAVHQTDGDGFWPAVDGLMGRQAHFKTLREKRIEEERVTRRQLSTDLGGPIVLLITASDVPRPNGIQVLMTAARAKK